MRPLTPILLDWFLSLPVPHRSMENQRTDCIVVGKICISKCFVWCNHVYNDVTVPSSGEDEAINVDDDDDDVVLLFTCRECCECVYTDGLPQVFIPRFLWNSLIGRNVCVSAEKTDKKLIRLAIWKYFQIVVASQR